MYLIFTGLNKRTLSMFNADYKVRICHDWIKKIGLKWVPGSRADQDDWVMKA